MRAMDDLKWIGSAIGVLTGGIAVAKLAALFLHVGFVGIPDLIVSAYTDLVNTAQKYLVEVPFKIKPPVWVKHAAVVWTVFSGTNWRFLNRKEHGEKILTGVNDFGRGSRRGKIDKRILYTIFFLISISGPLFSIFVLLMWLGNVRGGPSGQGRWGDHFMIGNRSYTRRISGMYLIILASQPIVASVLIVLDALGH